MKTIITYLFLSLGFTLWVEAAIRSDVGVVEASEEVQYSVQGIAKDYLLGYIYPKNHILQQKMQYNLQILDKNIQRISINTKNQKTKGILSYFVTQRFQIAELLNQKHTVELVETMLDISEIFSEGSKSIAKQHTYVLSREEKMLMLTKEMATLVASIVKYSIAISISPNDKSHRKKMKKSINIFMSDLRQINKYTYNSHMLQKKKALNRSWRVMQMYINKIDTLKVPALLSISSKNIQKSLEVLRVYHSKNQ